MESRAAIEKACKRGQMKKGQIYLIPRYQQKETAKLAEPIST